MVDTVLKINFIFILTFNTFLHFRTLVVQKINEKSIDRLDDLIKLWSTLFEKDIVIQNVKKLVYHVDELYGDIYDESSNRQKKIIQNIKG